MTTVVVPVFNGAHVLPACVPATLALAGVDEWIWVNDGSTDDTGVLLDRLLAAEPRARLVRHTANRGRAAARNTGADAARGDVLVFLDADVAPEPDTATRFAEVLRRGAVATVARLVPAGPLAADPYGEYLRRARRGVPLGAAGALPWRLFVTAACALRAETLRAAGGFDESVAYGEDLALAARLARDAPDGLRASGATAQISDTCTLARALANVAAFGAALPALETRTPGLLRIAGLDRALSPGWRAAVGRSRPLAALVRHLAPRLPAPMQPLAVRYLLGHTLLRAYDDARPPLRPRR